MAEDKKSKPEAKKPKCLISLEIYKTLVKNVSALFLYDDTISLIKQDETFQGVICNYLDAIYTYEDQVKNKDEQLDNLLVAYKTIVGKPYDPVILPKAKIDDLDDKISFLEVYLRNTLKIELSSILEKFVKDDKKIDPDTLVNIAAAAGGASIFENVSNPSNANTSSGSSDQNSNQSNNNFNAEDFLKNNNVNFNEMADATIGVYSRNLLYTKVLKNEFFVFDSKPSFFVWTKWIYLFGMILAAIAFIVTFIINIIPMRDVFIFSNTIPTFAGSTGITPAQEATIWFANNSNITLSSYVGPNIWTAVFTGGAVLLISFNSIKIGIKEIKYRNNDNYRFSCAFTPVYFFIIGLLFMYLIPLFNSPIHPLTWLEKVQANPEFIGDHKILIGGKDKIIHIDNAKVYGQMLTMSILGICLFSLAGLAIISALGIKLVAPKKNYELIQSTLLGIAADIKSNRISIKEIDIKTNSIEMRIKNDMRRFL